MSYLSDKYGDQKMLTERQRQKLCEMIHRAFIEIRILGWLGKSDQAADLADAFHELPLMIYSQDLSLGFFRHFLETYGKKYPHDQWANYLQMLDKIIKEENL